MEHPERIDPALWETSFPALGDRSPRALLTSEGGPDFVFEEYITGAFGERMLSHLLPWMRFGEARQTDPALLAYWRERGVVKRFCPGGDRSRDLAVYLPEKLSYGADRYPLVFLNHAAGRDFQEIEAWGFVQLAAREQFIVASVYEGNDTQLVRRTVERLCALYPVDRSRVYLVGHSFSGNTAARIAVSDPELFSGLAMLGARYYGADSTPAELERAAGFGLPRFDITGTRERRRLPYNRTEVPASPRILRNVTPPECGFRYSCAEQRMWRRINRVPALDEDLFREIQERSADPAEQIIGMPFDRTEVRDLGSRTHYIGDVFDEKGRPVMRMAGVEHAPHYPSAYAAELAWEFLRQFRRNQDTMQIEWMEKQQ